ncbi:MAG TPA: VWA domain-containing protein [Myxococcota bacterium]|nr:VWA domain-containing protein [Myxococcota bacterium]
MHLLLLLVSCSTHSSAPGSHPDSATDTDADTDTDSDTDADTDTDADSDGGLDTGGYNMGTGQDTGQGEVCDSALPELRRLYVSADDSNSQATPVLARALINQHISAFPALSYEFLNYYHFDYSPASANQLRIEAQVMESEAIPGDLELVVAVVAPEVTPETRRPLNLVFAVDTSGSMQGSGISLARATVQAIAHQLRAGDRVSFVTWATTTNTLIDGLDLLGPDAPELLAAAARLSAGDSTDLSRGLSRAYELAENNRREGDISRVVLISDGGANTGLTDEDLIGRHAALREADATYLIGVGVGDAPAYSVSLMNTVTDLGRGAHVFIDSAAEAQHQFNDPERFLENVLVAATDVQLALDLPPDWVIDRFSGEQISSNPREVVPQNLAPNDQMLYHMTLRNCGEEEDPSFHFVATAATPEGEAIQVELDRSLSELRAADSAAARKAVALVETARTFQGVWQQDPAVRAEFVRDGLDRVTRTAAPLPTDDDLTEVTRLLRAYADLF